MFRLLMTCFVAATLLASLSFAHDERLHKANALTGALAADAAFESQKHWAPVGAIDVVPKFSIRSKGREERSISVPSASIGLGNNILAYSIPRC